MVLIAAAVSEDSFRSISIEGPNEVGEVVVSWGTSKSCGKGSQPMLGCGPRAGNRAELLGDAGSRGTAIRSDDQASARDGSGRGRALPCVHAR